MKTNTITIVEFRHTARFATCPEDFGECTVSKPCEDCQGWLWIMTRAKDWMERANWGEK